MPIVWVGSEHVEERLVFRQPKSLVVQESRLDGLGLHVPLEIPVEEVFDAHASRDVAYQVGDQHHPR